MHILILSLAAKLNLRGVINMLLNIITWSKGCVICQANRVATFGITDAKCYFSIVTLSTQDNAKLLEYQTK